MGPSRSSNRTTIARSLKQHWPLLSLLVIAQRGLWFSSARQDSSSEFADLLLLGTDLPNWEIFRDFLNSTDVPVGSR